MVNIKSIITFVGICLTLFGFVGFFLTVTNMSATQTGRFYDQVPMHGVTGTVVDSAGNIFRGTSVHRSIQVYDNTGAFLYRFSFPTSGGTFTFYIDSYDIVHVAVARGNRTFSFHEGNLIHQGRLEHPSEFREFRYRRQGTYVDNDGNIYRIRPRSVRIYDEHNNFMRIVSPRAPIWPFSPIVMWFICALGMGLTFLSNFAFFKGILEAQMKKILLSLGMASILTFLTAFGCQLGGRVDFPYGVWESESPSIRLYLDDSAYLSPTQSRLGVYTYDDNETKISVLLDIPRSGKIWITRTTAYVTDEFGNRIRTHPTYFRGWFSADSDRMVFTVNSGQHADRYDEIIFYRVEEFEQIDPADWSLDSR